MLAGKSITLVAAMARNRAIGLDGDMPWHLPRELKHFKLVTMGHAIIMGRKTHESIGRALPGRQNIVISRSQTSFAQGCEAASSLLSAVEMASGNEVMIIGGGQIYAEALPVADRMILTLVDCEPEADTFFPPWDEAGWTMDSCREEAVDAANPLSYRVLDLRRG